MDCFLNMQDKLEDSYRFVERYIVQQILWLVDLEKYLFTAPITVGGVDGEQ